MKRRDEENFNLRNLRFLFGVLVVFALGSVGQAIERFPPPDFEGGYELPSTTTPEPRAGGLEWLDVGVLAGMLVVAVWLVHGRRSRRGIFVLMLGALAYFGFYRMGCICAIGAIQNMALSLADPGYTAGWSAVAFFTLPLVFALLWGRVFCGAVCPLGAIQDFVLVRPVRVPDWLGHALGLGVYVYFGLAVLLAATGSAFIICQYDPFVGFFRLSGMWWLIVAGACLLVIGMFVGRPYCRFLCPYAGLLRWAGQVSWRRVRITPGQCVNCRLCEDACPFGAINAAAPGAKGVRRQDRRRVGALIVLLPVAAVAGGWGAGQLHEELARSHATVRLADDLRAQEAGAELENVDAVDAFRQSGRGKEEVYAEAGAIVERFAAGAWLLGAFLGVVVVGKGLSLAVARRRAEYEADAGLCVACGRCFNSCPVEVLRKGETGRGRGVRETREEKSEIRSTKSETMTE